MAGAGNYTIHFTCPQAGIDETRNVEIPQGSSSITELFQIPMTRLEFASSFYDIDVEVKDNVPITVSKNINLAISAPVFDYDGYFSESFARVGSDLHLNLEIKTLSGISVPLNGQLSVTSAQLNYNDIKSITLQPMNDNAFNYTIPISSELASDVYTFEVQFKIDEALCINEYHSILIPPAQLDFSTPAASYNAGETIELNLTNSGGKNGQFDIQSLLKDSFNKTVLQKQETKNLTPGAGDSFQITLPQECKTGSYQLLLTSTETLSNTNNEKRFTVSINGLTASLNAYTLKENYFDNETISGKADISSPKTIENALLKARIMQTISSTSGITEQKHGEFIAYNSIEKAYQQGNKLYLATDVTGMGFLEYDKNTLEITPLYNLDNITINSIILRNNNELWLGTSENLIIRRDNNDNWFQYTTTQGFPSYWTYDIAEANYLGSPSTWVAGDNGLSVFNANSNSWKTSTTVNGLPSKLVYGLAVDQAGMVWALTASGLAKYNGTSFTKVTIPTGTVNVTGGLANTADGTIWLAFTNKLCKYNVSTGQWLDFLSNLCPGYTVTINEIETANGQLWARVRLRDVNNKFSNGLLHTQNNTDFTLYDETGCPLLKSLNTINAIIPGGISGINNDENISFGCQFGLLEFRPGQSSPWTHKLIAIDTDKLLGHILCLAVDSQDKIWAGTEYGLSTYDAGANRWNNYYSLANNQLIPEVMLIASDKEDRIYGYCSPLGGILKLENAGSNPGNLELIPFPSNLGFQPYDSDKMTVDSLGRIWLGNNDLYYYDHRESKWYKFPGIRYIKAITGDISNGLWVGAWNDFSQFHLFHIAEDLTVTDYTSANSGLLPWEKDLLYMDKDGLLWIKHNPSNWDEVRNLQSFDLKNNNWIDYTNHECFPQYGVVDFVKDSSGRLHVVDRDKRLYVLENNHFVLESENIYYRHNLICTDTKGKFYCIGTMEPPEVPNITATVTDNTGISKTSATTISATPMDNFLTLNLTGGVIEEEVWGQTYPVNLQSGAQQNIDLLTNKTLPSGS